MTQVGRWMIGSVAAAMLMATPGLAKKGGGGKPSGGDGGTACATFRDGTDDEVTSDLQFGGVYCHGTDGQVTVPKRFRIDLKKFNPAEREITLDALCGSTRCPDPLVPFTGDVIIQSHLVHTPDGFGGTNVGGELDFTQLTTGQSALVSLHIKWRISKDERMLRYGTSSDPRIVCSGEGAGPVTVTCNAADAGKCVDWTVATAGARACLVDAKREINLEEPVEADWTIQLVAQP